MTCKHCAETTALALAFGLRAAIYRKALERIASADLETTPAWRLVEEAATALAEADCAAPLTEDGTRPDPRGPKPLGQAPEAERVGPSVDAAARDLALWLYREGLLPRARAAGYGGSEELDKWFRWQEGL